MALDDRGIRKLVLCTVLSLAAGALARPAAGDETLLCNVSIQSLPYRITAPGHYCFTKNLSTPASPAYYAAITIDADSVVLDLNQFTLDGSAVGSGTAMVGILSANRSHITVRNGVVRGFFDGIDLYGLGSTGDLVENVWADHNYESGIGLLASGGRNVVRNNVVTDTGGSTNVNEFPGGVANGFGIQVTGSANVVNNEVTHTFGMNGGLGWAFALAFGGEGQIAANNRVIQADTFGFHCDGPNPPVVLRDNVVLDAATPYDGSCTRIGTTNFP